MKRILAPLLSMVLLASAASAAPAASAEKTSIALIESVLARRAEFGLGPVSTLVVDSSHRTPDGGRIVRLSQRLGSVPVEGGVVVLRYDASGKLLRHHSSAVPVNEISLRPTLSSAMALELARAAVNAPLPTVPSGRAELVVTRSGQLAWNVRVSVLVPNAAPLVSIDAQTGAVLARRDLALHAGKASVFESGAAAKAARQSDGSFAANSTTEVSLQPLDSLEEGSHLVSSTLEGYNCCPTENCDGVSPPKTLSGSYPMGGFQVPFTTVMCDERPVAAANADGDFIASPAKEPSGPSTPIPSESDGDAFAEINAFHWASSALAYIESLDEDFKLPPKARPLRVTSNFLLPDFNAVEFSNGSATVSSFSRMSNAMYMPAGAGEQIGGSIPGFDRDFDSIIFFQGERSDFAYDGAVVVHELGHGIVAATAGLYDYSSDSQGLIDAPGAMNEGFADYWAAAFFGRAHIGEYVGDLSGGGEGALRSLENDYSCPSVLIGEVHQDSQHFSAALWDARVAVAGEDAEKRVKFDRAVLAAMRQLTPFASFDTAAEILSSEIESVFGAAAGSSVDEAMSARKVSGCQRVRLFSASEKLSGTFYFPPMTPGRGWTPFAPGPVQVAFVAPQGANRVGLTITGSAQSGGMFGGGGGNTPDPVAIIKADAPVAFTFTNPITHDGSQQVEFSGPGKMALLEIEAGCEERTWYVAVGNRAQAQYVMREMKLEFNIDQSVVSGCQPPVVETPDAGSETPEPSPGAGGDAPEGCGCASGGALMAGPLALLALLMRRRRV